MVQVKELSGLSPIHADAYIDYLCAEWGQIPALAHEWADWDAHSRLAFAVDWPVCEDRLHLLHTWAAAGALSDEQQHRLTVLEALIAAQRPTLDRLLAD